MTGSAHNRALFNTPGNLNVPLRRTVGGAVAVDSGGLFVLACLWSGDLGAQPEYYTDPGAFLRAFITRARRGYELLLHGADTDMRYFMPELERLTLAGYATQFIVNARGQIMSVRITHGHNSWYVRDTFSLLPLPLRDLCNLAGYTGEYIDVATDPFDLDGPDMRAMLYRNARIVLQSYKAFADTLRDTFGIRPAVTSGASAMRAFRTMIPVDHVFYRAARPVEAFARSGYFGALNFLLSGEDHRDVAHIDINAMYAYAMRQGVPTRGAWQTWEEYPPEYPAMYECTITPPDRLLIPIVPYRDPETGITEYPRHGVFTSVLCSHTIALAREMGYKIDVLFGYVWEGLDDVFGPFVNRCEELEHEYRNRGARIVIKQMRNSLYGKFGQKETGKEYYLTLDPDDDMTPVIRWDGDIIENLYVKEVHIQRPYMFPHWAAWITASARNIIARAALALPPRSVYYGDNDSLMIDRATLEQAIVAGVVDVGTKYGQWKIAAQYESVQLWGKKRYRGVTVDGEIKEFDVKFAGVPKSALSVAVLDQLIPGGAPVQTDEYRRDRRAVDTIGGRKQSDYIAQTIVIPTLNSAPWQLDE